MQYLKLQREKEEKEGDEDEEDEELNIEDFTYLTSHRNKLNLTGLNRHMVLRSEQLTQRQANII